MKKIIICVVLMLSITAYANTPDVNDKVARVFKESFPTVSGEKWYTYDNYYTVMFSKSDVVFRVNYDLEGNMLAYRKDYYGKDLCPFICAKIKSKYPGKNIFGVTEIKNDNGVNYEITLEDDKHWYKVKSDAVGFLTLDQKMKKA